jgi:hypothetical protein
VAHRQFGSIARHIGYRGGVLRALIAEVFQLAPDRETEAAATLLERALELAKQLGGSGYWLDAVDAWLARPGQSGANWIDGLGAAQRRWALVLEQQRDR